MWIERDLGHIFEKKGLLESILIQGPRQVGKSSFLEHYAPGEPSLVELDDLAIRTTAERDPALFFSQHSPPIIIDKFHYAPQLLPEIKLRIDAARRERRNSKSSDVKLSTGTFDSKFFLSGSNQIEIDLAVKETLAGRLNIFTLHGLSINEIMSNEPGIGLWNCLWRGGFPELYVRKDISPVGYLNDYISTFIEKDIARSAGILKLPEFLTVIRLLAARVGNVLNREGLANDAGVASKTVSEWVEMLGRTHILYLLPVFSNNLNSRLTKAPKVYFIDTGIASRLQGHISLEALKGSPQIGAIFENLVVSEAIKTRSNFGLSFEISFWRTRDGEEIDLILTWPGRPDKTLLVEIKLAIQSYVAFNPPRSALEEFGADVECMVVTFGGTKREISKHTTCVPLAEFAQVLVEREKAMLKG